MVILDLTVVNVALPEIGRSLALTREALTWVVTGYSLTFGGLLILGGRLADVFGRRAVFLTGLALFTAASLTAGLAGGAATLLASRMTQGAGAAMLSPAALAILTTEFTGRRRDRALGVWAAIGGTGAAVGVVVGGALTSGPGWAWAFLVNVPIGAALLVLVLRVVPARPTPGPAQPTAGSPEPGRRLGSRRGSGRGGAIRPTIDLPGALAGTASVALLSYGLIKAGGAGWLSPTAVVPMLAAGVAALSFLLIERRARQPLVPLAMLRRRSLPAGTVVMLGASGLLLSGFFLSSIYLQHVASYSALRTGMTFLPVAVATVIGAHLGARALAVVGPRSVGAVALTVAGLGLALLAWRGTAGPVSTGLLPGFVLASAGIGAAFVAATTGGLSDLEHERAGVASAILNTGHELGGSLGIAVVSSIAATSLSTSGSTAGFDRAFLALAVAAVALAGFARLALPRQRSLTGDGPVMVH